MFVLDASIVFAVFFKDENSPYADAVMQSLISTPARVSGIWHFEIPNVFVVGERRNRCTPEQSDSMLAYLGMMRVLVDTSPVSIHWPTIVALTRKHKWSAYDASYLNLAMREMLPLASLDQPLIAAA